MSFCGRADEYVEGLLSPEEEQSFLAHLTACPRCQADLEEDLRLRDLEEQVQARRRSHVLRFRPARWHLAVAAAAVAVAATIALVVALPKGPPTDSTAPLLALAERRTLEGRVTYTGADRHRIYEVARGGSEAPGDMTAPEVIAELSKRGDLHGVATAYLLAGDFRHASEYLSRVPRSPDVDNDRALLALLEGRREDALSLLDEVLRRAPEHRQALWNRGLVLRELGLQLAAAESFARVAALDPEWRDEARARAEALRLQSTEPHDAWWAARREAYAMLDGGPPLSPSVARRFPGLARVFFHDALRLADSRQRVDALAPLAQELDRAYGGGELMAALDRARSYPFEARKPLLGDYLDFVYSRSRLDEAGWRRWLERARKARADDLILGALVLTEKSGDHLDELRRTARAAGSPWFDMLAAGEEARAARQANETARGERLLTEALARCDGLRVAYRCTMLEVDLMQVHQMDHRLPAARAHALAALERARRGNEWGMSAWLIGQLGEVERLRGRFPEARAYYEEAALGGSAEHCEMTRDNWLSLAQVEVQDGRPQDALRDAAAAPACATPLSLNGLIVHLDLYRLGTPVISEARLRQELESLRGRPDVSPGERLLADFGEARLVMDGDPARAEQLLRTVIHEAERLPGDVTAAKARSYAYTMLVVDAARRGAFERMAPLLVESRGGGPSTDTCTLTIARDDLRLAVAARGPSGALVGHYDAHAPTSADASLVPASLVQALSGCDSVRVLAQPPLTGTPHLLPPELAWGYDVAPGERPPQAPGSPRRLIVVGANAPRELRLPPLSDWDLPDSARGPEVLVLRGNEATPARVVAEMADATELQFHVHATSDRSRSDAPLLALAPDDAGDWALTAERIRAHPFRRHPVVLLADCHAGELAAWIHEAWGLPTAFLAAGARAVVASPSDVPDREATRFFDGVAARIRSGEAPALAVAAERRDWLESQGTRWVNDVIVFQ